MGRPPAQPKVPLLTQEPLREPRQTGSLPHLLLQHCWRHLAGRWALARDLSFQGCQRGELVVEHSQRLRQATTASFLML